MSTPVPPTEAAPLMVTLVADEPQPVHPQQAEPAPPQPAPRPAPAPSVRPSPAPPVVAVNKPAQAQDVVTPAPTVEQKPAAAAPAASPAPAPEVSASAAPVAKAAPPAAPAQPKVLPESAVRFLLKPNPIYPPVSEELGETGSVGLKIYVDEHGRARDVQVMRSSGYARLDRAAVAAEYEARFQPYVENGAAQGIWVLHTIHFKPSDR